MFAFKSRLEKKSTKFLSTNKLKFTLFAENPLYIDYESPDSKQHHK